MKAKLLVAVTACGILLKAQGQWAETGTLAPLNANNVIHDIHVETYSNTIYTGGNFKNSGNHTFIAYLTATEKWKELYAANGNLQGNNSIYTISTDGNGNVYAAGLFTEASDYVIAFYNKSTDTLSILGNKGFNGYIRSMVVDAAGNLYAAGAFKNNLNQYYVAKWDGISFTEVGTGINALNPNNEIRCLASDNAGNIYAAGFFSSAPNKYNVMKWDGSAWSEVGTLNASNYINDIVVDAAGNVYAAGGFTAPGSITNIAKWDGTSWTQPGNPGFNNYVFDLEVDRYNNLYAAGSFKNSANKAFVAKWDGNTWSEVGGNNSLAPNDDILSVAVDTNGNVYAGGYFTNAGGSYYVAKHTPTTTPVYDLPSPLAVKAFPSPFQNFLEVSFPDNSYGINKKIEVLDVSARCIYQQTVSDTEDYKIDTQNWKPGFYVIRISDTQGNATGVFRAIKSN